MRSKAEPQSGAPARTGESLALRTLVLVGFMGAGKSSVGRALAEAMGCPFEDLDDRIQLREKRSIEEIFRHSGEAAFRRAEHQALCELLAQPGPLKVVALGGGAFVQPENAALLRDAGALTVFLDAPVEELYRRCQQQDLNRPLRQDLEHFRRLYTERSPAYRMAQLRVETCNKAISIVADEIMAVLNLPLGRSTKAE